MATPLTIGNFEFDKLRAKSPEMKKGGNITYYSVAFEYEDRKLLLKTECKFRLFKHDKGGYSIAIGINDENKEFFTKLGERMAELAYEQRRKIPKPFKASDFELVKTSGKYKNVCARIYTSKSGKVECKLSERIQAGGTYKRKRINIYELIDETFKGFCVVRIYQAYIGSSKSITLSVEEIIVTNLSSKKSYFDEYESN